MNENSKSLNVSEIKVKLKQIGGKLTGNKKDLIER